MAISKTVDGHFLKGESFVYDFSVPMALVDYIPVILFGYAVLVLQRDLYLHMRKGCFALFAAGSINVFCAGFCKATWKLLYAAGICDFAALNTMFLPVQSIGFLLIGLGLLGMFFRKEKTVLLAVPPVFKGTFLFIGMMVAGLGCMCACLSVIAARMKKLPAIVLFLLAFVGSMGMGYMSSHDSTSAIVNWIEQGINTVSQGCLMAGVILLDKAGLREFDMIKQG